MLNNIYNLKGGFVMKEKIIGMCYIVVAALIIVVKYTVPGFFDILIWLVTIGLIINGIYLIIKK
jgi:hypothetical protein